MAENDKLSNALMEIGRNDKARAILLNAIRDAETVLAKRDLNVRDDLTGTVIDALHRGVALMSARLENGLVYHFHYRGKIAREIVMNPSPALDHLWEPQLTKLVVFLAQRARRHIVIGGAYSGDHALLMASEIARYGGLCHCFEPNEENSSLLRYNAQYNKLTNIVVNQCGLWESDDLKLVLVGDDSHAHAEPARGTEEGSGFQATTLQSYGAKNGVDSIDLILLDIEGAEMAALRGAERYLAQPRGTAPNVVFEVHGSYVDWSNGLANTEIVQYLVRHGYTVFAVRDYTANVPMKGQPIELLKPEDAYLEGPPHGFNMVAVKDPAILEGPLFRYRKDVSPKLLPHRDPRLHAPIADGIPQRRAKAG